MEPKKGYEFTLVNKAYAPTAPAKEQYNYLIVKCDQPNAVISIDGQYAGEGETSQYFKVGETHTWSIECNLYHPESGSANIIKGDPVTIDKTLRPAFGYLNVTTKPESGATVFIDNTRIGETPCKSGKLASGQHKVRVMKELYTTTEQTFTVTDGNTIEAAINMAANYVNVTVTTDSQSDIYIDNEKKGKGTWSGRLNASEHFIEAKKTSHKTAVKTVMLTDKTVFDLNTGTITYYIDDKLVSTQKVSGFSPQNIKFFNIRFQSYGWYTGHYTNYDYIRISTK